MRLNPTLLFGAALAVPLGGVAIALTTQHVFEMQPCAWCVLQRLIFVCIALAALPGLLWHAAAPRRVAASVVLLFAGAGITAALWQHFVASSSASCNRSPADRIMSGTGLDAAWPEVFAPMASCADAAVTLLGVPYEFYSLALFMLLAVIALRLLVRPV